MAKGGGGSLHAREYEVGDGSLTGVGKNRIVATDRPAIPDFRPAPE